jgi:hypothetical protein
MCIRDLGAEGGNLEQMHQLADPGVDGNVKQSHSRPEQAPRVDRSIALHFLDLGSRRGCVVTITHRPLYPRERSGTHCTGG